MGRKANQKRERQERNAQQGGAAASGGDGSAAVPAAAAKRPRRAVAVQPLPEAISAPATLSAGLRLLVCTAVLVLLTLGAYWNSFDGQFILDDTGSIVNNSAVKPPVTFSRLMQTPRPLTAATFAWNWTGDSTDTLAFHRLNLALHMLCGLLLFVLGRSILRLPHFEGRYSGASGDWLACAGAALFLVHPIQTESVTYIVQRAEAFGAASMMAMLLLASHFREPRNGTIAAMLIFPIGLLGIYGKETVIVIPALFLVYDVCFLSRMRLAPVMGRAKLYAAMGVVTAIGLRSLLLTLMASNSAGFQVPNVSGGEYLRSQITTVGYYFRVIFIPDSLCFDCGYFGSWPVINSVFGDSMLVWGGLLLLIVLSAFWAWQRFPLWTFAILGSAVVMAPTSTFVPLSDLYVEHRLYLPIGFLGLAVAVMFYEASSLLAARVDFSPERLRAVRFGTATVVCALLTLITVGRNDLFADPIAMWEDTLQKAPQNRRVQYTLGNFYGRAGRYEDAIERYKQALLLKPGVAKVHVNMGSTYNKMGRPEDAVAPFQEAVRLDPKLQMARRNLARTLQRLGRLDEAEEVARAAVASSNSSSNQQVLTDILKAKGAGT